MSKQAIKDIENLIQLIDLERQEEITRYKELLTQCTLKERKAQGVTWYPIQIQDEQIGIGEQITLTLERVTGLDKSHKFRTGQTVELFTQAIDSKERLAIQGVIQQVKRNTMHLSTGSQQLPDWIDGSKLGIDLLYNETTFKEMDIALQKLLKADRNRLAELREVLLGYQKPSQLTTIKKLYTPTLNDSQQQALKQVAKAEDIAIIHGPPGTGKTTTLVAAIKHTLTTQKQVLVVAPSNTAVDLLTKKLLAEGLSAIRIGHPARVNEDLQMYTFDATLLTHPEYKRLQQLRKEAQQIRKKAYKFKRNFGFEERMERKALLAESRTVLDEAKQLEKYISDHILSNTQVITATLVGSSHFLLRRRTFETVFIDEAGQALAPATWIPITRANRVVLAGDHLQLPPTVKSKAAEKQGLATSLFESCIDKLQIGVMLDTQYRMNEKIMQFSSNYFYEKRLTASPTVKHHTLGSNYLIDAPVDFIDTAGCGYEEKRSEETRSISNKEEGNLLLKYIQMLLEEIPAAKQHLTTIGLIAPYKEQVIYLRSQLAHYELLQKHAVNIAIHTVDGFQGQERDIIGISMVRSNETGDIGFLGDTRRMNVAMTRAKKKLVMVGDSATLGSHKFYKQLLQYVENIEAYKSAWEFIY